MSWEGYNSCFTCGIKKYWKELQCGHFVPRRYMSLRWDEINCQAQCHECNVTKEGNLVKFAENLKIKFGKDIVDLLNVRKQKTVKYSDPELWELVKYYSKFVK